MKLTKSFLLWREKMTDKQQTSLKPCPRCACPRCACPRCERLNLGHHISSMPMNHIYCYDCGYEGPYTIYYGQFWKCRRSLGQNTEEEKMTKQTETTRTYWACYEKNKIQHHERGTLRHPALYMSKSAALWHGETKDVRKVKIVEVK
jgi:hypothetical protein